MAMASLIDSAPVIYEQAGQCYYEDTDLMVSMVSADSPSETPTSTPVDVGVSVEAKCKSYTDYGCSCVTHVKNKGINTSGRNAEGFVPNAFEATAGDVAQFYYANTGTFHVAYVEEVYLGAFLISECNFKAGECGTRVVSKDDPALRGFVHPVKQSLE
tara:strand:+ start:126 stop:599 length:474 start_codon:yes stop_codon:yes gene_type:complete